MALLTSLLATALLMALGLSVALIGTAETTLAARDRDARSATYAARAGVTLAIAELESRQSWSGLLAPGLSREVSATPGPFADATLTPVAPWGGSPLDLRALTTRMQAESDASSGLGGDAPVWRLFVYGALPALVPAATARNVYYLAVWVADDRGDGDGNAAADTNGIVLVHAEALGAGEARATIEATVLRQPVSEGPDLFRVLAIRAAR